MMMMMGRTWQIGQRTVALVPKFQRPTSGASSLVTVDLAFKASRVVYTRFHCVIEKYFSEIKLKQGIKLKRFHSGHINVLLIDRFLLISIPSTNMMVHSRTNGTQSNHWDSSVSVISH